MSVSPTSPAAAPRTAGIAVRVTGLSKRFDAGAAVIEDLHLQIGAGDFVAILGPSGSGKSTLLRMIAGLERPTAGDVRLDDDADGLARRHGRIAYVFQDAHLLPWRSVVNNVELPLELRRTPARNRRRAAMDALDQVGLAGAAGRYPGELSGGMRMRVSLARALVTDPQLLLLDEPFAALDEITRHRLDEQLRALWARRRMTTLFVTHSTTEAVFLAQRAVVLSAGPARVVEDRAIALPDARDAAARSTAEFARETRYLFEALERGSGGGEHAGAAA